VQAERKGQEMITLCERTVGHYTVLDVAIWKSHLAGFVSDLEMRA
jgi:hypothetical protein